MGPIQQQQQQVRSTNRSVPSGTTEGNSATSDRDDALRAQIFQEIVRKAKVCANTLYECSLPRVDSYAYCFRHILQDPKAPFKQCGFLFPNGRRCLEPSPRYDAKKDYGTNYCFEHSRQTQLKKTKSTIGKLVPVETTETLLHSLAHHVKVDKNKQHYMGMNTPLKITVHEDDDDTDVDVVTPSVDPFVDVDVTAINDSGRIVLDYASDSSSDGEDAQQPTYGSCWKGQDMDNSDNESVDSQCDDPLKHAGIYTAEETTRITKEKLSRLQTLYVEQLQRLQHVLRERRRNFLKEQRAEREKHCTIYDQINETPHERKLYEKLKGLYRYHRKNGVEAILQRKYLEKRAKATEGLQQKPPSLPKCSYTEGGVKCGERTLPCCKHCRKHILEDKKQVLFRACGIEKSGVVCQEPLAGLFENGTCPLHVELPAQRSFNKRKYDSESDGEGEPPGTTGEGNEPTSSETTEVPMETTGPSNVAPQADEGQNAKELLKTETNTTGLKTESRRKIIKREIPITSRSRSTRAARAALKRREQAANSSGTGLKQDPIIKQEKEALPKSEAKPELAAHSATKTESKGIIGSAKEQNPILDEDQLPVSIILKKKIKCEEDNTKQEGGNMEEAEEVAVEETSVDQKENPEITASKEQSREEPEAGKDKTVHQGVDTVQGASDLATESLEGSIRQEKVVESEKSEENKKEVVEKEKLPSEVKEDSKELKTVVVEIQQELLTNEMVSQAKRDRDAEAKSSHSSPEPTKRRRAMELKEQQKREKNNKESSKGAAGVESKKDQPSSPSVAESKVPTSDEEKVGKSKQPRGKQQDAVEAAVAKGGGEKPRRQHK